MRIERLPDQYCSYFWPEHEVQRADLERYAPVLIFMPGPTISIRGESAKLGYKELKTAGIKLRNSAAVAMGTKLVELTKVVPPQRVTGRKITL